MTKDLGVAPETLRRWCNQADATVTAETRQSAQEAMSELRKPRREVAELRRANEILTTRRLFFRGQARPDTPLMVAYVDEHKGRFEVGPICRVLSESLDCGFITPRGCRMFKNRPVSRMAARHEDYLDAVAEELNNWPRKTLGYMKPSEKNIELLDSTN